MVLVVQVTFVSVLNLRPSDKGLLTSDHLFLTALGSNPFRDFEVTHVRKLFS